MNKQYTIVPFAEGLRQICRGRTSYYQAIKPESPHYDPALPLTVPVGNAPNSPRAFVQAELDAYVAAVVNRARNEASDRLNAAKERSRLMIKARGSKGRKPLPSGE